MRSVDGPPPFGLRRKPCCSLSGRARVLSPGGTMATLNRRDRREAGSATVDGGGKGEGWKHGDLTYRRPLSNDSVFKRPYGGGGGVGTHDIRRLTTNDQIERRYGVRGESFFLCVGGKGFRCSSPRRAALFVFDSTPSAAPSRGRRNRALKEYNVDVSTHTSLTTGCPSTYYHWRCHCPAPETVWPRSVLNSTANLNSRRFRSRRPIRQNCQVFVIASVCATVQVDGIDTAILSIAVQENSREISYNGAVDYQRWHKIKNKLLC